jgi:hypothetical protein
MDPYGLIRGIPTGILTSRSGSPVGRQIRVWRKWSQVPAATGGGHPRVNSCYALSELQSLLLTAQLNLIVIRPWGHTIVADESGYRRAVPLGRVANVSPIFVFLNSLELQNCFSDYMWLSASRSHVRLFLSVADRDRAQPILGDFPCCHCSPQTLFFK